MGGLAPRSSSLEGEATPLRGIFCAWRQALLYLNRIDPEKPKWRGCNLWIGTHYCLSWVKSGELRRVTSAERRRFIVLRRPRIAFNVKGKYIRIDQNNFND